MRTSQAVQEDFGSVVSIGPVQLTIVFAPVDGSDFTWAVQFASRGDSTPIKHLVGEIVDAQPARFRNSKWLTDADFRKML